MVQFTYLCARRVQVYRLDVSYECGKSLVYQTHVIAWDRRGEMCSLLSYKQYCDCLGRL
jgi:hypothetical protein